MYDEITEWLKISLSNKFIVAQNHQFITGPMCIYLRVRTRDINGFLCKVIDIGSIDVQEPYQSKNYFSKFLNYLEKEFKDYPIYIENVFSPQFKAFFIKRGYIKDKKNDPADQSDSFYKM